MKVKKVELTLTARVASKAEVCISSMRRAQVLLPAGCSSPWVVKEAEETSSMSAEFQSAM